MKFGRKYYIDSIRKLSDIIIAPIHNAIKVQILILQTGKT